MRHEQGHELKAQSHRQGLRSTFCHDTGFVLGTLVSEQAVEHSLLTSLVRYLEVPSGHRSWRSSRSDEMHLTLDLQELSQVVLLLLMLKENVVTEY